MHSLVLIEIGEPTPRVFNGLIGPRDSELHDHGVAKPRKGRLNVRGMERAKNKPRSLNLRAHLSTHFVPVEQAEFWPRSSSLCGEYLSTVLPSPIRSAKSRSQGWMSDKSISKRWATDRYLCIPRGCRHSPRRILSPMGVQTSLPDGRQHTQKARRASRPFTSGEALSAGKGRHVQSCRLASDRPSRNSAPKQDKGRPVGSVQRRHCRNGT